MQQNCRAPQHPAPLPARPNLPRKATQVQLKQRPLLHCVHCTLQRQCLGMLVAKLHSRCPQGGSAELNPEEAAGNRELAQLKAPKQSAAMLASSQSAHAGALLHTCLILSASPRRCLIVRLKRTSGSARHRLHPTPRQAPESTAAAMRTPDLAPMPPFDTASRRTEGPPLLPSPARRPQRRRPPGNPGRRVAKCPTRRPRKARAPHPEILNQP